MPRKRRKKLSSQLPAIDTLQARHSLPVEVDAGVGARDVRLAPVPQVVGKQQAMLDRVARAFEAGTAMLVQPDSL